MITRLLDLLRRWRVDEELIRPNRPNELRLDIVRAERRQREMRQADVTARTPPPPPEAERPPRVRDAASAVVPTATGNALARALRSRASLRRAWVVKEVLDAPVALRKRHLGAEPRGIRRP